MRRPSPRRGSHANPKPRPPAPAEGLWSAARFFLTLILLAWAVRSFVVAPFSIPSGSMLPTLYIGDYLVVAKWPYGFSKYSFPLRIPSFDGRILGHEPARGDVVVFRHPNEHADLIKRVIAVPGDTIAVVDGQPVLNGRPLARAPLQPVGIAVSANSPCKTVPPATPVVKTINGQPICFYPAFRETLPNGPSYVTLDQTDEGQADNFAEVRVPAGHLFLMGDNRDDSLDSRYPPIEGGIGMVPEENLIGRALVTFWSTDGTSAYWKPWTWFSALRGSRIGNRYTAASR